MLVYVRHGKGRVSRDASLVAVADIADHVLDISPPAPSFLVVKLADALRQTVFPGHS